jgi:single-stranded-DNA-specific exonuclease
MKITFKGYRWEFKFKKVKPSEEAVKKYGLLVAQLLANRGLKSPPAELGAASPSELPFAAEAAEKILDAVKKNKTIVLFGDYDVDGITSTALMKRFLKKLGAKKVRAVVPERHWGYGLSPAAAQTVTKLAPEGLVIALDNGTKEVESVKVLHQRGWECVIFDHHELGQKLPDAPLVNPKLLDQDPLGLKDLSTVGLVYLFGRYLESFGFELEAEAYLDLVALGTVADVSPMGPTNARLVAEGLKLLREGESRVPVLRLLTERLALRHLNEQDISFKLAPRFNAFGRMGKANLGLKSLLAESEEEAGRLLEAMERLNEERKRLTEKATAAVLSYYDRNPSEALVFYSPQLPKGILGIIAGRSAAVLGVPTVVLSRGGGGELVGSSRSPEGLDIVEVLKELDDLMLRWGGHPQAAGLSLKAERLGEFKLRFTEAVRRKKFQPPALEVDFPIEPLKLKNTPKLLELLDQLSPFGVRNPFPTFVFDDTLKDFRKTRYGYRLQFEKNGSMFINTEGEREKIPPVVRNRKVRVVYQLTNPLRGDMTAVDFMVIS